MYFCNMNRILLNVIGLTYSYSQSGAYALILGIDSSNANCCGDANLRLPIIIGEAEAQSIAIALEGHQSRRPLTHDLFKSFATAFDIEIKEVVINRFKDGLFFSELHCLKDGETCIIDARTSDAVALALRFKCPIYTYHQVMEEAGIVMDDIDTEDGLDQETTTDDGYERYDIADLESLLNDAIENEDYATASILRDEINKRKGTF